VAEQYRTIRNTLRFVLGNLSDFDPNKDMVDDQKIIEDFHKDDGIDWWVLNKAYLLETQVRALYKQFDFYRAVKQIYNFCNLTLSAIYLDILKDRLYTDAKDSPKRRRGQTALYHIGRLLMQLLAPVLVFTSEEAWRHLPKKTGDPENIHLLSCYDSLSCFKEKEEDDPVRVLGWDSFIAFRQEVLKKIEEARTRGEVGSSMEAKVEIVGSDVKIVTPNALINQLKELLIVSDVKLSCDKKISPDAELKIKVTKTEFEKCLRCWVRRPEVGKHEYIKKYPEFKDLCPKCAKIVASLITGGAS